MEETIFTAGTKLKKLFSVNCKKPPEEENGKKPSIDPPLVETHALAATGNSQSPKPKLINYKKKKKNHQNFPKTQFTVLKIKTKKSILTLPRGHWSCRIIMDSFCQATNRLSALNLPKCEVMRVSEIPQAQQRKLNPIDHVSDNNELFWGLLQDMKCHQTQYYKSKMSLMPSKPKRK